MSCHNYRTSILALALALCPAALSAQSFIRVYSQYHRTEIPQNSTSANAFNQCAFGIVPHAAGSVDQTFVIDNPFQFGTLTIDGPITITGADASSFQVSNQPNETSLIYDESTQFSIKFDPTSAGFKTATVNIPNNSSASSPFHFTVNGNGVSGPQRPLPSLAVVKQTANSLKVAAGGMVFLKGSVVVSNSEPETPSDAIVRIYYSGEQVLTLGNQTPLFEKSVKGLAEGKPRRLNFKLAIQGAPVGHIFMRIEPVGTADQNYTNNQWVRQYITF